MVVLEHVNLRFSGQAEAFAVQVHATAPPGLVLWRPEVFMAYRDSFTIELHGPSGHASQPHLVGNLVDAAGEITGALKLAVA